MSVARTLRSRFRLGGQQGCVVGGRCTRALRARGGDRALVPVEQGNGDHGACGDVMKHASDAGQGSISVEGLLREARVHSHVVAKQTDIDPADVLRPLDLSLRDINARRRFSHVSSLCDDLRHVDLWR